jgi:hypothetical protein
LPSEIIAGGVSETDPPDPKSAHLFDLSYSKAIKLQRALLKVAGWPDCRALYAANLSEAERWAGYCAEPDHGGQDGGTPASRRRKLEDARLRGAYRQRLLAELDDD